MMARMKRSSVTALIAMAVALATTGISYAAEFVPADVALHKTGAGWLITNKQGTTLYTHDPDASTPGKSSCTGKCATAWPPFLAPTSASASGDWSLVAREGGQKQWAFRRMPLYFYARDNYPGAAFGDGEDVIWHVAIQPISTPPQFAIASNPPVGRVLTNPKGMTVYAREGEAARDQVCDSECQRNWAPVSAPWLAKGYDAWSVVDRGDGTKQWAYQNKPLYTSSLDALPGDIRGDRPRSGWKAVVLEPAPALPAWATVQNTDMGAVIADHEGMTIYAFSGDLKKVDAITCDAECRKTNFRSLVATKGDKPVGNWAIATNSEGALQWTFKGDFVYTHTQDARPGDIVGDKFGHGHGKVNRSGGWWRPIVYACVCTLAPLQ